LRGFELLRKIGDQDPAFAVQVLHNGAPAFFVEHRI
jgi:hypothetical protein